MSEPFRRARWLDRAPEPDEILADLVDLHAARAGVTEATLGAFRDASGATGYELLAAAVPSEATSVLDLGCGNGPLLEVLAARRPPFARVVGVDACAPEIARARERLGDRVELRACAAQDFDVEPASIDAVLSHHAFYLFVPVEPVIERIARALRPRGLFAFMTVGAQPNALFAETMALFGPLTKRDNPHFGGWGDPRVWTREGLEDLLVGSGRFRDLRFEPVELAVDEPPATLCDRLMRFFYSVDLQAPRRAKSSAARGRPCSSGTRAAARCGSRSRRRSSARRRDESRSHGKDAARVAPRARFERRAAVGVVVGDRRAARIGDRESNAAVALLEQVDAHARVAREELLRPARVLVVVDVGAQAAVLRGKAARDRAKARPKIAR